LAASVGGLLLFWCIPFPSLFKNMSGLIQTRASVRLNLAASERPEDRSQWLGFEVCLVRLYAYA
jgi:hypothetical protein